jgi:glycosyltransferase involved in cell wall biosynthesis
MRILLLNTSFPPQARSAARLFHDLGSYLTRLGHEVTVVTELPWRRLGGDANATVILRREHVNGMNVHRVRGYPFREQSLLGRGINLLWVPFRFYFVAGSAGRQDVALVYSPPLTLGLTAWMLKRRHGVPFVFNVQDIYPQTLIDLGYMKNPLMIRVFEWIERFIYRQAARIVVHSEGNRQYLVRPGRAGPNKVVVIPNWVDTEVIRPSERLNQFRQKHGIGQKFLVCYAGTMGYAQDLSVFFQAADQLRAYEDILFLLVGEGVRASEWREKAEELRLSNVLFLPLQTQSEYLSLVNACDVGLVPLIRTLRTPVVPAKLLDFMAVARPVIASVNLDGDTSRIIHEANCGYAFAPDDPEGVRNAVLALYEDPSLARKLGRNARRYAEVRFSLKTCAGSYEELFSSIVHHRGRETKQPARVLAGCSGALVSFGRSVFKGKGQ